MQLRVALTAVSLLAFACGDSGNPTTGTDGGLTNPDGSNLLPDGAVVTPDGAVVTPDGSVSNPDGSVSNPDGSAASKHVKTIFLILMENHNWSSIKGSASAPYINGLLATAAHAENYYDNPKANHPSEPNYIWLEAADNLGITTDADPSPNHLIKGQNHLTKQLQAANVTWRAYEEDTTANQCPIASNGYYAPKHLPMVFFDDVVGNPPAANAAGCTAHVVPYTQLATDLSGNTVAQYNFITPNLCNDMHGAGGCPADSIKTGDTWLSGAVKAITASQAYKDNGAIFITWDESEGGEFPIGMIVLSPLAKPGYTGNTKYFHSSMVRTVETVFGIKTYLNDAANQSDLSDLFTAGL